MLCFLVSEVWRDISLFIEVHFYEPNEPTAHHPPLKSLSTKSGANIGYRVALLDYDMRSLYRSSPNYIGEDEQLLQKLIVHYSKIE